jgi:hypothetical protein
MSISVTDKIADFPVAGIVPISDSRFATRDIRLSSALCCLGFDVKIGAQPIATTIDAEREQRIVTFFHEDQSLNTGLQAKKISARDVELWWSAPGKFSIEGYDDALTAIHRLHRERERMIAIAKWPDNLERSQFSGKVATRSLHTAAILASCEIKLVGYESRSRQWIFGKGSEVIADLIKIGGKPKDARPLANDLCIDWMLLALRYRDWLARMVKNPDCIPLIEMRDGQKILQISAAMDEREQRKWMTYL